MSILARLKKQDIPEKKRLFAVVAGPRLAGKTTLAGTLVGRTLLLQAAVLESGSESAKSLATENGNELWVDNFTSIEGLLKTITELATDTDFDHIYVDGLSALTEMKLKEPKIKSMMKTDNWGAFREIGDTASEVILALKALTYADKATKPKNVFISCALKIKQDKNGAIVDVELETKGNVAVSAITKLGEAVLTVLPPIKTETGETQHKLITKSTDWWPGRIDGLLAHQNPGAIEPASLNAVLKLLEAK